MVLSEGRSAYGESLDSPFKRLRWRHIEERLIRVSLKDALVSPSDVQQVAKPCLPGARLARVKPRISVARRMVFVWVSFPGGAESGDPGVVGGGGCRIQCGLAVEKALQLL